MRKTSKRLLIALVGLVVLIAIPNLLWISLTYKPRFYRTVVQASREQREAKAKHFQAQSLQLYNDIRNEPEWVAVFTDQEVNAWLAQDLVSHFADQIPPGVHEPRVIFELDRITLAFELDQGPFRSVIWIVGNARVPERNVIELTVEKVRAGVLPVPAERYLDHITDEIRSRGVDVQWKREGGYPVAVFRYRPDDTRDDVWLERLQVLSGQIRLAGTSKRPRGMAELPKLPSRKILQLRFPRRKTHPVGVSFGPVSSRRNSALPTSRFPRRSSRTSRSPHSTTS